MPKPRDHKFGTPTVLLTTIISQVQYALTFWTFFSRICLYLTMIFNRLLVFMLIRGTRSLQVFIYSFREDAEHLMVYQYLTNIMVHLFVLTWQWDLMVSEWFFYVSWVIPFCLQLFVGVSPSRRSFNTTPGETYSILVIMVFNHSMIKTVTTNRYWSKLIPVSAEFCL